MEFLKVLKKKKLLFLNIFFLLYISVNLFTGERGIVSYFEKNKQFDNLGKQKSLLIDEINNFEKKNNLLSKNLNIDFIDTLVREKFVFGKKDEVLIKIDE